MISKRTGLSKDASAQIVQFANVAREKSKSGLLTQPPSLRQLLAWATAVKSGIPVTAAYQSAVINKYPADCEAELKGIFTAVINVPKFKTSVGA